MATSRVGMKDFYRQKKNSGGISKPSSKTKSTKKTPTHSSTVGSDAVQPPTLISHGALDLQDEYDSKEELLRQFDMNMAYGPCIGMTRLARWERAHRLGLNPPINVETLLRSGKANAECLWDGRV